MLIDTHCHLDASEFDADRAQVVQRALDAGVQAIVIPAVASAHFDQVRELAHATPGGFYALGIHPMYVLQARDADLLALERAVEQALDDPRFVAIGEIGLDFFVPQLREEEARARQEHFYARQLALAQQHGLPVLLHVRRSQDTLLKYLRRHPDVGGIAHAFNGSFQQAQQFVERGFALGLGGAMTYERALQIRRLATGLSLSSLVLETDAPDIPPEWLQRGQRNEPAQVARIADVLAQLRGMSTQAVARETRDAACRVLPRLARGLPG